MRGLPALLAALACLGCSVLNGLSDRPGSDDGDGGGGAGDGGGGGDGAGGGDGGGGGRDGPCRDAAPEALSLAPGTIHLMVDRSGSMDDQLGVSGVSQWQAVLQAIAETVGESAPVVRFGASSFSGAGTATCPDVVTVLPALDNAGAITNMLAAQSPSYVTPAEAFQPVIDVVVADPGRPRSIVVLTDDPPHLCAGPTTDATAQAVAALAGGFAQGILTRVVRVDVDDPDASPFQRMANAGAGQPDGAATPYDTITSFDGLELAMRQAFADLAPCRFPLSDPLTDLQGVTVSLDGVILDAAQWSVENDALVLAESACASFRASGTAELVLLRPCG